MCMCVYAPPQCNIYTLTIYLLCESLKLRATPVSQTDSLVSLSLSLDSIERLDDSRGGGGHVSR